MTERQLKVVIGGLLHDIGKVLYRNDDGRNHSESGYDFLKNEINIQDTEILNQIRYHHANHLKGAKVACDSLTYITYIADNIASVADRRKNDTDEQGFIREAPFESIFNILNGNHEDLCYQPMMLGEKEGINYPAKQVTSYDASFYKTIYVKIKECLREFSYTEKYVNSLLEILEATLSFVPSSTSKKELADISLYDHMKLTSAIGSCIIQYLDEREIKDYRQELFLNSKEFYSKKVFLIYSMDLSGIQDFIYTIKSKKALKGLRARSFYLEIMMEHIIDELLEKLNMTRTNLIYSGGGHAYLLVANTPNVKQKIESFEREINQWFLEVFQTSLYIGGGYAECSTNDLKNQPSGSYVNIFKTISKEISRKKLRRYQASEILRLNYQDIDNEDRECSVCRRVDRLRDDDQCEICWALEELATGIMNDDFFVISKEKKGVVLPLPCDKYLTVEKDETQIRNRMLQDKGYVRAYSKNMFYSGYSIATKLWVGDFKNGNDFQELSQSSQGIERIAILRADVDNLGEAFVAGFKDKENDDRYVTLTRTATFSKKLSLFFKYHMNYILKNGVFYLKEKEDKRRKAVIVYSGGDDLFIVGSWDDIIGFSIDLYYSLQRYTQKTLTISGGIGIYPPKFPISVMAKQTGELEEVAKGLDGKNAVALFDTKYTFHWDELIENVIGEKFKTIQKYMDTFDEERGKAFLYKILELIRAVWKQEDGKINIARFAYQLARVEPESNASQEKKSAYNDFSISMYQWIKSRKDAKELEVAIYLYVYLIRDEKGE